MYSAFRYFSLHKALPKCPLTVSKVSVVRLREVLVLLIECSYGKLRSQNGRD